MSDPIETAEFTSKSEPTTESTLKSESPTGLTSKPELTTELTSQSEEAKKQIPATEGAEFAMEEVVGLVEKKLLVSMKHPRLLFTVYHYSERCVYDHVWNPCTLKMRGMSLNTITGVVVSRPMCKFFNFGDKETPRFSSDRALLAYEKLDGSLIVVFNYEGEWICNSSQRFESFQAAQADKMLHDQYREEVEKMNKKWTYCFELIIPENRIVVDYGQQKRLVLLCAMDNESGREVHANRFKDLKFDRPKVLQGLNITEIQEYMKKRVVAKNGALVEEGLILHVPVSCIQTANGLFATNHSEILDMKAVASLKEIDSEQWAERVIRVKVKYDLYKIIHRVASHGHAADIIGLIRAGQEETLGQFKAPGLWREMKKSDKVQKHVEQIKARFAEIEKVCKEMVASAKENNMTMKAFAKQYSTHPYQCVLFAFMRENADQAKNAIWTFILKEMKEKEKSAAS